MDIVEHIMEEFEIEDSMAKNYIKKADVAITEAINLDREKMANRHWRECQYVKQLAHERGSLSSIIKMLKHEARLLNLTDDSINVTVNNGDDDRLEIIMPDNGRNDG